MGKNVKKPCMGCVYFKECGETTRTAPCAGRKTKSEKKREQKKRGAIANIEITAYKDAKLNALRLYMYERGITHNASAAFNLVRFDIYTDEQGADAINRFLDDYDEQHGRAVITCA